MKKGNLKLLVLVALLVVVGVAVALLPSPGEVVAQQDSVTAAVKVDDSAPDFTVTLTDGQSVTLSDLRGKVVLLNFWATWCPPCREELKRVQADLIDRFADRDFVFLPISRGEQAETVVEFLEKNQYSFAAGLDPEQAIYKSYADQYIPRNYLINRHGVVVEATIGYEPEEFDALLQHIEMTLNAR